MNSKKVLVTTDFSDVSYAALEYAATMDNSEITLLSIVQVWDRPPELLTQVPDPEGTQEYRQYILNQTEAQLDSIAEKYFHNTSIHTKALPGIGNAAEEICKYSDKNNINVIVMAGHGRGSLGSLLIGSTVQKVLHIAKCPVIVVPNPNNEN